MNKESPLWRAIHADEEPPPAEELERDGLTLEEKAIYVLSTAVRSAGVAPETLASLTCLMYPGEGEAISERMLQVMQKALSPKETVG